MTRSISLLRPIIYGEWEITGECQHCHKPFVVKKTCSREEALEGDYICRGCVEAIIDEKMAVLENLMGMGENHTGKFN